MRTQANAKADNAAALTPPRSPWRVVSVKPQANFRLWVEFQDGTAGAVDMDAFVHADDAGVFASLADPARFAEVFVDYGVVTWPGELDLAPDAMHQAILETGQWVLA
ncbi:DUF2442 domain-containing protein [Telmatospirillum sp.]|uniref:DUF2442 domain-containing protein n=1 Tax=Telmatospirillum sp. TaxID=2079197 RepID=UPI00284E2C81|nr:DUF2442 domain-containing protein [Telmatospirillum sp.]MDR3436418.1 DUF2442 domain-containing protein [Telmatospirillum sp.]